ncbi:meprin A subunit beta [Alligator mississippiensis]|uniref:Metalloendopeptidase n=1 Tax=Alligator mississippiensis TaxID=8496 RepID=A0A151MNS8_ALLMI|nr:meprin A subunit beta [Alligator mississippiensis]
MDNDVDGGIDQDIFDINEEMNAKGVILKAFEQYRLKSCIDFKPWEGEENYISVFKGSGCWSSIGNRRKGKQELSIGANCDRIGTVQHEFLHALGFWHEQSRSDRNDYVTIMWDRISTGKEHNFNTYDDKTSNSLNTPYDFTSVMHYSKNAFRNGTEATILTNIPDFMDVIGQRMDFSDYDLRKLHRLYNCSSPVNYWQLYHISLNVTSQFRIIFEGIKGIGSSFGGLSIDDINLSETQCPHHVWHIRNFTHLLNTSLEGKMGKIYSPPFYSSKGYAFQIGLYVNGTSNNSHNLAIYLHSISGANDDQLAWPCAWQQATMILLDQHPDIRQQMSNQRSVTTDPSQLLPGSLTSLFWDRPDKVGSPSKFANGTEFRRGPGSGTSGFLTHQRLRSRDFIKGDDVYILSTIEDISHLISTEPNLPNTTAGNMTVSTPTKPATTRHTTTRRTTTQRTTTRKTTVNTTPAGAPETSNPNPCKRYSCENDGICVAVAEIPLCRCPVGDDWWYMGKRCEKKGSTRQNMVVAVASTVAVFVVMLIITIISTQCIRRKYHRRRQNEEALDNLNLENRTSF